MTATRLAWGIHLDEPTDDVVCRLQRIALALPAHCVFVGHTAALIHGLWVPPSDRTVQIAHTATGRGRNMSRTVRSELTGSRRELPTVDVTDVDGLRVTTAARTWRDLAASLRPAELVALGDSVLRTGVCESELLALMARTRGRRGAVAARAALPLLDRRSRSRPESHVRFELLVPGWPRFEVNQSIHDRHGGWLAEPDLSNERYRIAVEYQGGEHAGLERMRRDLTRGTCVAGESWQILPVGPAEAFRQPDRLRLAVRAMLVRAGWRPGSTRPS